MYRYQLEKYRGRSTRHVCPQCGRKNVFTRYVDTENNNIYISDKVGKCNRLDKCGYHYTPHQYFTDNPWKRDAQPREGEFSFFSFHREKEKKKIAPEPTKRCAGLPRRVLEAQKGPSHPLCLFGPFSPVRQALLTHYCLTHISLSVS
jgi:hypothetical protein